MTTSEPDVSTRLTRRLALACLLVVAGANYWAIVYRSAPAVDDWIIAAESLHKGPIQAWVDEAPRHPLGFMIHLLASPVIIHATWLYQLFVLAEAVAAGAFAFVLLRRISRSDGLALAVSAVWLASPAKNGVLGWAMCSNVAASAWLGLAGLCVLWRYAERGGPGRLALGLLIQTSAVLCYEQAVLTPFLLAFCSLLAGAPRRRAAVMSALWLVILAAWHLSTGQTAEGQYEAALGMPWEAGFWLRFAATLRDIASMPLRYAIIYAPFVHAMTALAVVLGAGQCAFACVCLRRARPPAEAPAPRPGLTLVFALGWVLATAGPTSVVGWGPAPRFYYTPALGLYAAIAAAACLAARAWPAAGGRLARTAAWGAAFLVAGYWTLANSSEFAHNHYAASQCTHALTRALATALPDPAPGAQIVVDGFPGSIGSANTTRNSNWAGTGQVRILYGRDDLVGRIGSVRDPLYDPPGELPSVFGVRAGGGMGGLSPTRPLVVFRARFDASLLERQSVVVNAVRDAAGRIVAAVYDVGDGRHAPSQTGQARDWLGLAEACPNNRHNLTGDPFFACLVQDSRIEAPIHSGAFVEVLSAEWNVLPLQGVLQPTIVWRVRRTPPEKNYRLELRLTRRYPLWPPQPHDVKQVVFRAPWLDGVDARRLSAGWVVRQRFDVPFWWRRLDLAGEAAVVAVESGRTILTCSFPSVRIDPHEWLAARNWRLSLTSN